MTDQTRARPTVKKVLVVEDDPMVALIHQRWIDNLSGFQTVSTVNNTADAITTLEHAHIDIAIVDLTLINSSGVDLIHRVRERGFRPEIIVVTADRTANTIDSLMRLGVDEYLVKPFTETRFRRAMQNASMRRELLSSELLSQAQIDFLRTSGRPAENSATSSRRLPKGIAAGTLESVIGALPEAPQAFDAEEVASAVGISQIVARRYLNYLAHRGELVVDHQYGHRGRPTNRYVRKRIGMTSG